MMSENEYVTEKTLDEFAKRVDQEDKRQNERIDHIERSLQLLNTLAVSVEKLAINMENLTKEVASQGSKLNDLEMKPAKRYDLIVTTLISGVIGALVGFVSSGILK